MRFVFDISPDTHNLKPDPLHECYNFVVEDQRLHTGGFSPMSAQSSLSHLFFLAAVSVFALGSVVVWSMFGVDEKPTAPSLVAAALETGEEDPAVFVNTLADRSQPSILVEDIGPMVVGTLAAQYSVLKDQGLYTPETAATLAAQLAEAVSAPVEYKHYTVTDLHLSSDTSYDGMLTYRAALQDAIAPLMRNKEPEIGIFAGYVETRNAQYLDDLRAVAADYAKARDAAAALTVPKEAASVHIGILEAMGQFGAVLEALADNAADPITSTALLQTYNDGEENMITSFNNLAMYYAHHPKP